MTNFEFKDRSPVIEDSHYIPKVKLIDNLGRPQQEIYTKIKELLQKGELIVADFGATYGLLFDMKFREKMGVQRRDKKPYEFVSMFASPEMLPRYVDFNLLPRELQDPDTFTKFIQLFEGLGFVRYPARHNEEVRELGPYACSRDRIHNPQIKRIQFFLLPNNDPLMKVYKKPIGVRSANISGDGKGERYTPEGAYEFAQEVGASLFAERYSDKHHEQKKRFGSMFILILPTALDQRDENGCLIVRVERQGNTSIETIETLIHSVLPDAKIILEMKKEEHPMRKPYTSQEKTPNRIKHDLMKKANGSKLKDFINFFRR